MKVWLVQTGEPLPTDMGKPRLLRTGELAKFLASVGDDVTWWTSSFSHQMKIKREIGKKLVKSEDSEFEIQIVKSFGYQGHVSVRRIIDEVVVANDLRKLMRIQPLRPDVIVASMPTISAVFVASRFARQHRIPFVIDVRDLWPDILEGRVVLILRPFAQVIIKALRLILRRAMRGSIALTATSENFLSWALTLSELQKRTNDRVFPLAYRADKRVVADLVISPAMQELRDSVCGRKVIIFAGTLSRQFEFKALLDLAKRWECKNVLFIICGDGPQLSLLHVEKLQNVVLTGWIGQDDLLMLMQLADVAIAPYIPTEDFKSNIPNKIPEFLANGLPIVTSLGGGLAEHLLSSRGVGTVVEVDSTDQWESAIDYWLDTIQTKPPDSVAKKCQNVHREIFDALKLSADYRLLLEQVIELNRKDEQ